MRKELVTDKDWEERCPKCKHPFHEHTTGVCIHTVNGITPGDLYACGCKVVKIEHYNRYFVEEIEHE